MYMVVFVNVFFFSYNVLFSYFSPELFLDISGILFPIISFIVEEGIVLYVHCVISEFKFTLILFFMKQFNNQVKTSSYRNGES